jgi:hypothetical protein
LHWVTHGGVRLFWTSDATSVSMTAPAKRWSTKGGVPRLPEVGQEGAELLVRAPYVGGKLGQMGDGLGVLTSRQLVQRQRWRTPKPGLVLLAHGYQPTPADEDGTVSGQRWSTTDDRPSEVPSPGRPSSPATSGPNGLRNYADKAVGHYLFWQPLARKKMQSFDRQVDRQVDARRRSSVDGLGSGTPSDLYLCTPVDPLGPPRRDGKSCVGKLTVGSNPTLSAR